MNLPRLIHRIRLRSHVRRGHYVEKSRGRTSTGLRIYLCSCGKGWRA